MLKHLLTKKSLFIIFIFVSLLFFPQLSFSKTIDEEISDISQKIADLEKAIAPLKQETGSLTQKIRNAKSSIYQIGLQIEDIGDQLIEAESDLEVQHTLLNQRIKRLYKNNKKFNPLLIFLSSSQNSSLLRQFSWFQSVINQDMKLITNLSSQIITLQTNKTNLDTQKKHLATLKTDLENRFGFLTAEIKKAEDYKAELSQKQQELIAAKTAMFSTSVGDVSTSQDPASRADYNPGFSPAFALFSFGAPHRKGMSQYGAFGRSKAGQNYQDILKAYYGNIRIETTDMPGSISTTLGSLPFEDRYLLGIAEMPAKWGEDGGVEALKAQAIAARTYALSYVGWRLSNKSASGTICTTESCQVYSNTRYSNPGLWKAAVEATRGQVIVSNSTNDIFSTMYASTSGGAIYSYSSLDHSTPQIWDTTCSSQSCWPGDAWEKQAGSAWYYKGWYKTRSNQACSRSHPWLTQIEFIDIVNAVLYYSKTNDSSHLSQIDSGGCFGGNDPSAWSRQELARQVVSHGGPISSVTSINVNYSTSGYTQEVRLETDKGSFTFTADNFKTIFNLRAPGAIVIKSSLFNIEKK